VRGTHSLDKARERLFSSVMKVDQTGGWLGGCWNSRETRLTRGENCRGQWGVLLELLRWAVAYEEKGLRISGGAMINLEHVTCKLWLKWWG